MPVSLAPRAKPRKRSVRLLERSPGQAGFRKNATYQTHRGYYYKDAGGRWRTPDGARYAKPERASSYNARRMERLVVIDATNRARILGIPMKLQDARRIVTANRKAGQEAILRAFKTHARKQQRKGPPRSWSGNVPDTDPAEYRLETPTIERAEDLSILADEDVDTRWDAAWDSYTQDLDDVLDAWGDTP